MKNLATRPGLHEEHARQPDRLAGGDAPALLIEPECEHRPDHHEAGEGGEQDIVELEQVEPGNDRNRYQEDRHAIDETGQRLHRQIAPAGGEPGQGGEGCLTSLPSLLARQGGNHGGNCYHDLSRDDCLRLLLIIQACKPIRPR